MKRLQIFLILIGFLHLSACKNPELAAYRLTGTVVVTVNDAMNAFADAWVAGLVTPQQKVQVDQAYDRYYAAVQIERAAITAYKSNQVGGGTNTLNVAVAALTSAEGDVLFLIYQFLPPAKVAQLKGVK